MLDTTSRPLLEVAGLEAWYGESHILHGVEFNVRKGEVVTLLGRNGAGKTTSLKSIMGIVGKRKGSIRFDGTETISMASDRIARLGVAFCPEERGIFSSLDVRENLMLPPEIRPGGLSLDRIFELGELAIDPRARRRRIGNSRPPALSNIFVRHAAPCGSNTRTTCISASINTCKTYL